VRTESRALARLEELGLAAVARAAGGSEYVDIAVHHLDNPERAANLARRLQDRVGDCTIVVSEVSAAIGVHVGPGMLGLVISPRI
jgi:fatty acid-binding protein DegV